MNNDLNFLNQYTETLHENFDAIIKQNIVFQTNLKIAEKELAILNDAKSNVGKLTDENRELKGRIGQLEQLMGGLKTVDEDKSRLQIALNETSQTTNSLRAEVNSLNQELARLKNQQVSSEEDKTRLQSSLNETSQSSNTLKAEVNSLNQEISRLKLQVQDLPNLKKEKAELEKKLNSLDTPTISISATKSAKVVKSTAGTF